MNEKSWLTDAKSVTRKTFRQGHRIFSEGEKGYNAYVILSGTVEIFSVVDDVKVIIGEVRENGLFGEMALIDGEPRMGTAMAVTDVNCMVIPIEVFSEKLENVDPFTRGMLRLLSENVRTISKRMVDNFKNVAATSSS